MPFKPGVSGNPDGKPVGTKAKVLSLRDELIKAFERNREQFDKLIDGMFENKKDFQWLCELRASLEPKRLESDGSFAPKMVQLIRNEKAVKEEIEAKFLGSNTRA